MSVDLTDEEVALKEKVRARFELAEDRHKAHRDQWVRYYRMYRSFRSFADTWQQTEPRGRDTVMAGAQDTWGAELHIPYAFSTVETILPRMLSSRPRMLVLPRRPGSEDNAPLMRQLIDAQQERIRYELKLQDTAKSGLIYGLGVQKVYWKREKTQQMGLVPGAHGPEPGMVAGGVDDPDVDDVDIFDFFWDPMAASIDDCRFVIHRTWRDHRYVMDRVNAGVWKAMSEEEVRSSGPTAKYDEVISDRMRAQGLSNWNARGSQLHEVWEYWDRQDNQVVTVLDREIPMQQGPNPYWHGEIPFVAFRPTTAGVRQLPGIGEIDPIEDLVREMDTLRSQRRDNAALKLDVVFAYSEGMVDPSDLVFFPGAALETKGEPRDLLMPINVGDIPNSGYQEESNLQADIERTTGISDPVSGAGDASQTATGVQLVQAAANVRIQNKTRRVEVELAKPTSRFFGRMDQQMIQTRRDVRIPSPPQPGQPDRRWTWAQLGPAQLMGEFDYEPEGGSTAPENIPQMRQDALQFTQTFGNNPHVQQQLVMEHALTLFGIKNPQQWIIADPVPQNLPEMLVQMGVVSPEVMQQAIEMAQEQERAEMEGTPNLTEAGDQAQQEQERAQASSNGKG